MSSGTELSAMVFGQHNHLTLILVIFFFCGSLKDQVYNSKPWLEEIEEEILRKLQLSL
jgi:hypothetical protein